MSELQNATAPVQIGTIPNLPKVVKFALKPNVKVKIDGVEYSETTNGVPDSIAILFIAKNIMRYALFEEIEDINVAILKYKQQHDFEEIDIDATNDTDIFIYGLQDKLPIRVALFILVNLCGAVFEQSISKSVIQTFLKLTNQNVFGKFKQYAMEWLNSGQAGNFTIFEDGSYIYNDGSAVALKSKEAKQEN